MERVFKKVKSKKTKEIYSVLLTYDDEGNIILSKSSCTCIFGSYYRFARFWRRQNKLCRHMVETIKENGKHKNN